MGVIMLKVRNLFFIAFLLNSFIFAQDNNEGVEHQLKNTECGVYSIYFITSLLTGVRSPLYFKKNIIRDRVMEKYRKIFFNDI